ncbi:MAG: hypothetical protein D6727_08255 [Gammaproteobacteria bacterium]|nr:MAG: hypothetical protein D6727_08255 [Gammaproteobacteria bacterium]
MSSRRHAQRPEHLRATIADEAARIMQESGLADFRAAKAKAVERMGLGRQAPLPGNAEIEAALAERNRVFGGDRHAAQLQRLRRLAADLMLALQAFRPRLVGAVLSGHATEHSAIDLHLFADAAEAVGAQLDSLGLRHRPIACRHRWRRGEEFQLPGYRFRVDGTECLASVFPERRRAHAPLSPVDGRPMRRAGLRELQELLAAEP